METHKQQTLELTPISQRVHLVWVPSLQVWKFVLRQINATAERPIGFILRLRHLFIIARFMLNYSNVTLTMGLEALISYHNATLHYSFQSEDFNTRKTNKAWKTLHDTPDFHYFNNLNIYHQTENNFSP